MSVNSYKIPATLCDIKESIPMHEQQQENDNNNNKSRRVTTTMTSLKWVNPFSCDVFFLVLQFDSLFYCFTHPSLTHPWLDIEQREWKEKNNWSLEESYCDPKRGLFSKNEKVDRQPHSDRLVIFTISWCITSSFISRRSLNSLMSFCFSCWLCYWSRDPHFDTWNHLTYARTWRQDLQELSFKKVYVSPFKHHKCNNVIIIPPLLLFNRKFLFKWKWEALSGNSRESVSTGSPSGSSWVSRPFR